MVQKSIPSRQHYAAHYPAVLECAGLTDGDDLAPEFETRVRAIFNSYWSAHKRPTIAATQEALELYIKGQAMVREAMQSLDSIDSELDFAARLHDLPGQDRERAIERYLDFRAGSDHLTRQELADELVSTPDIDALIKERDRGIAFLSNHPDMLARLFKRQTGDYRKDAETALVVEPALDLLEKIGFTPSKQLPRRAFFEALFDLLGIEQRRRPTPANISVIVNQRKKKSQRSQHKAARR
jgi:hypothetical protein